MRTLHICLVAPHYPPYLGGVENHVQHLAEGLAASSYQVDVLTQADPGQPGGYERVNSVAVFRHPMVVPSRHYAVSPALYRELRRRRHDYDLFHAHNYHGLPALAAALAGCRPLIFTPHYLGTGFSTIRRGVHRPYHRLGRRIFEAASAIICVSEPERMLVARHFPQVAAKLVLIPDGVDREGILSAPQFDIRGSVLLVVSRLERYKRVDRLIMALGELPGDWSMAVTGDGPARGELEHLAEKLGLASRVRFLGHLPLSELHSWLRTARVLGSMSSNEAAPIVVVEALAAATPAILSAIPAHEALAWRWPEGVTVAPPEASAIELARLIEAAAERGRPEVVVPSLREVLEQTIAVYEGVVSR